MNLLTTATALDFEGWLRGLFSAGISGGASAIVGGITVSGMDSKDYNFYTPKFYVLIGALFLANAIVSMSKFLSAQPLPGLKQVETTVQTITPSTGTGGGKVIETVKETHVVPMDPPAKETGTGDGK